MTTHTKIDIDSLLTHLQRDFEVVINNYLPPSEQTSTDLEAAMHYAVKNGGKRLRPTLVYLTGELLGIHQSDLHLPAVCVELIHAYSLIHDDLPAMDNSHLRRGKPTCHLAFDEATAILAGDCLQTLAFEQLIKADANMLTPESRLAMLATLANVSGYLGMGGGQALDLSFTGKQVSQTQLLEMYQLKTGALIQAAITLPAQMISLENNQTVALHEFGHWLGLAFQVQDDILDYEADSMTLGKPQKLDQQNAKYTMVNAIGLEQAKVLVKHCAQSAITALTAHFDQTDRLVALVHYLSDRKA